MSIVTVIHQPRFSIVELFHSMLLLGKGGQTVFLGNSEQALNYFSDLGFQLPPNENPADFFLGQFRCCDNYSIAHLSAWSSELASRFSLHCDLC